MNVAVGIGRNPASKTGFSLSAENEQTDTGRDGQTYLPRSSSQARTGTGKYSSSLFN